MELSHKPRLISQSQRPKSLGQSRDCRTVPEAQESPGTLELSQRPRVPTPWGLFLNLRNPKVWDSPSMLGLSKNTESQHNGSYFSISETQKPGTVPELWHCPRSTGQSRDVGTVPKTQSPNTMVLFLNLRDPIAWDSPRVLGLSKKPGTVLGRLDCPKDPESQHHGGYFAISETQNHGSVLGLWDCPRSPGQSWDVGTVPEARDSPRKCSNFMVFDTCCWPL